MFEGQFTSDNWHRGVASTALRNAIRARRWGMRVTVYTGGSSGEYVLTYNLASTNLQDNNNWLKVVDINTPWGTGAVTTPSYYRGFYDASGNTYPATGGSGGGGAILAGDQFRLSVGGTLNGVTWVENTMLLANIDAPGQVDANWRIY